ncbi:hypothetical protein GQ53DRAFT_649300, partial [Thozetella sp. PMI_491]
FDRIVSIEMIEHVGHDFLDTYFEYLCRYLKMDGVIAYFESITIPEPRYIAYRRDEDFNQRYIFPEGHLPTISGLVASIDRGSKGKLIVEEIKYFGEHYSKAFCCWEENFLDNFDEKIAPTLQKSCGIMTREELDIFRRKWEPCY